MINLPCVIFAGGKSSRMGEDKALLPFGSFSTLTEFQFDKLSKIFTDVYISCKYTDKFTFTNNLIKDLQEIYAPTSGFISVFDTLKCDSFFAISVDTPFIDNNIINKIHKADSLHADATVAKLNDNIQPMCGIYHKSLYDEFVQMAKDNQHKLAILLKNSDTIFVDFDDEKSFFNLNNPQQYKEAMAML